MHLMVKLRFGDDLPGVAALGGCMIPGEGPADDEATICCIGRPATGCSWAGANKEDAIATATDALQLF
ncbi:unnamed protein product [Toxocara canis]|uniref:Biotin carboxylation domain-containing protein n=1 Tax=Toxocara canis TaxID=6265 RepID=A0A183UWN9_TOXCA|nr:unnamed protein product [Toxocara canis]